MLRRGGARRGSRARIGRDELDASRHIGPVLCPPANRKWETLKITEKSCIGGTLFTVILENAVGAGSPAKILKVSEDRSPTGAALPIPCPWRLT